MEMTDEIRPYTLYYNDYSICSLMVRFTLACCQPSGNNAPVIEEKKIDIHQGEQLAENYLSTVNPKGTVPVLACPDKGVSITESLDITYYLLRFYPDLSPFHISGEIRKLLDELHRINYFSLTYTRRPDRASAMLNAVEERLADPTISERYRNALKYKREVVCETRAPALDAVFVGKEENKALAFLSQIATILHRSAHRGTPWLFGTVVPTALDAHTVTFLARLIDVGRGDMIESTVRQYADSIFKKNIWTDTMQDRQTVHHAYRA